MSEFVEKDASALLEIIGKIEESAHCPYATCRPSTICTCR